MDTIIGYLFVIYVLAAYVHMTFISRTAKEDRYKARMITTLISIGFGIGLEFSGLFNVPFGLCLIGGSAPLIYISVYELIRRIMKPWIGDFPYAPYWDRVGEKVIEKGYPPNRVVSRHDYIFAYLMSFVPVLIIIELIIYIK